MSSEVSQKRHGRFSRYVPLVLWIVVILILSSGQGSMSETSRFIGPLLEFLFPDTPPDVRAMYHGYIRKAAHVTVYGVLGLIAARAFITSSKPILRRYWFAAALVLAVALASVDEINQSYLASRTGSPWDVALDTFGASIAVLFVAFFVKYAIRPTR